MNFESFPRIEQPTEEETQSEQYEDLAEQYDANPKMQEFLTEVIPDVTSFREGLEKYPDQTKALIDAAVKTAESILESVE